jgi:hypothetical protein
LPQPAALALREIAAGRKDAVLASVLRGDHRKMAAREEQVLGHQRRGHLAANADQGRAITAPILVRTSIWRRIAARRAR